MYDFDELDRLETKEEKKDIRKASFFAKLAYCWINLVTIIHY